MTPDIKKILYATDLSPNSAYALRYALDCAMLYNAEIVIMHAIETAYVGYAPILTSYIDEKGQKSLYENRVSAAKAVIEKRLKAVCDEELNANADYRSLVTSIEVCEGFPAERILETAKQYDCDMIIMGTHGKGIIGNTFLGSTAKRVLRRTRKPIFIIPLPKDETHVTIRDNVET
jgi:nucleotide-binding universal stress UspA family protein